MDKKFQGYRNNFAFFCSNFWWIAWANKHGFTLITHNRIVNNEQKKISRRNKFRRKERTQAKS